MSDREEIYALYESDWDGFVKRISNRVGGAVNAEDVVQEAFTRALKYHKVFDSKRSLKKWFNTVLNNAAADFVREERDKGGVRYDEDEVVEETTDTLDKLMFDSEMVEKVIAHIDELVDPARTAVRGHLVYGYTSEEVAQYCEDIKPATIRKLVQRFKESMVEKYGEDMGL